MHACTVYGGEPAELHSCSMVSKDEVFTLDLPNVSLSLFGFVVSTPQ